MILWTVQDMAAWERLQEEGLLQGDGRRVEPYHRHAYQWMAEQMRLRLPPPHPHFPFGHGIVGKVRDGLGQTCGPQGI